MRVLSLKTRPKGNMGSSYFLLGGATGRMEENTVNICLCVLKRNCVRNARHDETFSVRGMSCLIILKKISFCPNVTL